MNGKYNILQFGGEYCFCCRFLWIFFEVDEALKLFGIEEKKSNHVALSFFHGSLRGGRRLQITFDKNRFFSRFSLRSVF